MTTVSVNGLGKLVVGVLFGSLGVVQVIQGRKMVDEVVRVIMVVGGAAVAGVAAVLVLVGILILIRREK